MELSKQFTLDTIDEELLTKIELLSSKLEKILTKATIKNLKI